MFFAPQFAFGDVYARFGAFLPRWAAVTLAAAVAAWLVLRRFRPALDATATRWSDRVAGCWHAPLQFRRDWYWLVPGAVLLLLATDFPGFTQGFFRWDDFSFIEVAREPRTVLEQMRMYHSDHSLPLFRLWVAALVKFAGPAATPDQLAGAFNAVNFASGLGVVLGGIILLAEFGVRRMTAVCYALVAWLWPGWGEMTTGFYTLIVYPQTLVAGLGAIVAVVRYVRGHSRAWLVTGLLFFVVAGGLDVSGVWVFFAIGGFALAVGGWRHPRVWQAGLWFGAAFCVVAYYHLVWFHHPFAERELVQNPRGLVVSQGLVANLVHYFPRLALIVPSGLGATILSPFIPGFAGLLAPAFQGNWMRSLPLYVAELGALGGVLWLLWRQLPRFASPDRRTFAALAFPVLVVIGMTCIARAHALNYPASLWPTKYFCVPQAWAALAGAFFLDRAVLAEPEVARRGAPWIAGALGGACWLAGTFWHLERALAIEPAWLPAGRQGNTAALWQRRAEYGRFLQNIEELSRLTGRKQIDVPPPLGMYWAHRALEYGYDPQAGGTYAFPDLLAVAPRSGITLRVRPRREVPPEVLRAIDQIPGLARVFDPTPPNP